MEMFNGPEQRDFRLLAEIIVHIGACVSVFIGTVTQTPACDKALKMTEHKINGPRLKSFRRLDNGEWHPLHGMLPNRSRSFATAALRRRVTVAWLILNCWAIFLTVRPKKKYESTISLSLGMR